jgi:hypothetical protein
LGIAESGGYFFGYHYPNKIFFDSAFLREGHVDGAEFS